MALLVALALVGQLGTSDAAVEDPYAGGVSGTEVALGAGLQLGLDALSVGALDLAFTSSPSYGVPLLLLDAGLLLVGPAMDALLVRAIAGDGYHAGSVREAIFLSGVARAVVLLLLLVSYGVTQAIPPVWGLVALAAVDVVAVPLASSYGLHDGPTTR